ncbi:TrbI/VirB10 family protein [Hyphomonas sp.]|uniref:TrbI/VirB10 family protein n=1 Tax=Hyphomonas sp. TaxID=87 RepID=UPI002627AE16|nr:TrbI/VirB10 family protein [Hyphomonas sp.]MDF1805781.1 TrbI/VirB10 family protein [Hyphomonas sp.]
MADANTANANRRKLVAVVCGLLIVGGIGWFLIAGQEVDPIEAYERESLPSRTPMTDLARQPVAESSAYEAYEDRLEGVESGIREQSRQIELLGGENASLRAQLAAAQAENDQIREEAEAIMLDLSRQISEQRNATPASSETRADAGPPAGSRGPGASATPGQFSSPASDPFAPAGVVEASGINQVGSSEVATLRARAMQSVTFGGAADSEASATSDQPEVRDAVRYVPPNSFAPARVLVGVDATTGTTFGADPKPVLLRITGSAVSVIEDGEEVLTDLEGCLINGAAWAELSSEKVYVRLQRMTCPLNDGSGRVTESEVEGYVAFGGKAGVRGRVISREGDLAERALIAGTLQGLGNSFSRVGTGSSIGGALGSLQGDSLSGEEIAVSSLGEGLGEAAGTLAQYYIERAEQYQPVVEMPTGIDVEIVFISGVTVR